MNGHMVPLTVRVREACEHYGTLFDSLEATVIEEALGRRIGNSVACEGRDRVEWCEVLGKWQARVSKVGFQSVPIGQSVAESLRVKLNSGTRGICFGWMGIAFTVAATNVVFPSETD
ncbi:hypothetical protein ACS0TY_012946 [Phlomoides rotata]